MKTIKLKIQCGDKTCASKPGRFCRFISIGKIYCTLFDVDLVDTGWIMRCNECLKAEI